MNYRYKLEYSTIPVTVGYNVHMKVCMHLNSLCTPEAKAHYKLMLGYMRNHPSLSGRYAMKSQGIILEISIAELILSHEHEFHGILAMKI